MVAEELVWTYYLGQKKLFGWLNRLKILICEHNLIYGLQPALKYRSWLAKLVMPY